MFSSSTGRARRDAGERDLGARAGRARETGRRRMRAAAGTRGYYSRRGAEEARAGSAKRGLPEGKSAGVRASAPRTSFFATTMATLPGDTAAGERRAVDDAIIRCGDLANQLPLGLKPQAGQRHAGPGAPDGTATRKRPGDTIDVGVSATSVVSEKRFRKSGLGLTFQMVCPMTDDESGDVDKTGSRAAVVRGGSRSPLMQRRHMQQREPARSCWRERLRHQPKPEQPYWSEQGLRALGRRWNASRNRTAGASGPRRRRRQRWRWRCANHYRRSRHDPYTNASRWASRHATACFQQSSVRWLMVLARRRHRAARKRSRWRRSSGLFRSVRPPPPAPVVAGALYNHDGYPAAGGATTASWWVWAVAGQRSP